MKSYVVGIDIGGTNTKLGIVDSRGTVLAKDSIKTNKHQCVEDYIEDLHKAFTALTRANGLEGEIGGIGVGAPNANYFKGTIEYAANLPWKGIVPFAELMEKKFGIPVKITNDANAAAIGEMTYGAARGVKDFIMITLGTGVGSGIVANGQLIYGSDGNAGELGTCHCASQRASLWLRPFGVSRNLYVGDRSGPYGARISRIAKGRESFTSYTASRHHLERCLRCCYGR